YRWLLREPNVPDRDHLHHPKLSSVHSRQGLRGGRRHLNLIGCVLLGTRRDASELDGQLQEHIHTHPCDWRFRMHPDCCHVESDQSVRKARSASAPGGWRSQVNTNTMKSTD